VGAETVAGRAGAAGSAWVRGRARSATSTMTPTATAVNPATPTATATAGTAPEFVMKRVGSNFERMKLLLVEDDKLTAEFVKRILQEDGHEVDWTAAGREGLMWARMNMYDALILDLNLPDTTGLAITEALRHEGRSTPILMLTASSKTESVVQGLNAGADDYLVKPFKTEELRARVRALTRRGGATRTEEVRVGGLVLNRLTHQVYADQKPLKLTPKEYKLLEYFLLRPDQVITRTELLEKVWEMNFDPQSNIVDAHVARVRTKLRNIANAPQIETARGFGFILKVGSG
jgi:two-component system OmpR family response regulator